MAGPITDAEVDKLEPAAEELVAAVAMRDQLSVEAVLRFADPTVLALILADLVAAERDRAAHADRRRIAEVRDARKNANPDAGDFAQLLERLRLADAEVMQLRKRVWDLPGGVQPAGVSLERAEQIAAEAAQRKDRKLWPENH